MPVLRASNVSIMGRPLVSELRMRRGEMVALIGPNGSGKTSLLRVLAGIEEDAGNVTIGGETIGTMAPSRRKRAVGFLPATRDLRWPLSVRDLIRLGSDIDPIKLDHVLAMLELETFADRRVDRLSTGERTRVLIARILTAMIADPPKN